MKRAAAYIFLLLGAWALIAPQANLGLPELRWMSRHTFPAESLLGVGLLTLAYLWLQTPPKRAHADCQCRE